MKIRKDSSNLKIENTIFGLVDMGLCIVSWIWKVENEKMNIRIEIKF